MNQSISVILPCFNDEKSIGSLIDEVFNILPSLTNKFEIIVIDDASNDNSREVLKKQHEKYPQLKLIFHKKNLGYGGALRSGFKAARKSLIFYTDGDGQYKIDELKRLVPLMTPDINFVNGIKMSRHDPNYRIVIGNLYSFIIRWFFYLPIYDVDCDFRLMRRSLIKKLHLKSTSGSITVELTKKAQLAGGKFCQVSVHHFERRFGKSQFFRADRIFFTLFELSKLWFDLIILKKV